MKFIWEVLQQEDREVVVRYRRVFLKGEVKKPEPVTVDSDDSIACSMMVEPESSARNDIGSSIEIESPLDKSVNIYGSLEVNASFGELDIIGSLEVINNSASFDLGSTLEVRGVVEVVERYGKDYMVRGRITPTASDEVIKTMIDLMVKNDYLKHRLVGMKGELLDA